MLSTPTASRHPSPAQSSSRQPSRRRARTSHGNAKSQRTDPEHFAFRKSAQGRAAKTNEATGPQSPSGKQSAGSQSQSTVGQSQSRRSPPWQANFQLPQVSILCGTHLARLLVRLIAIANKVEHAMNDIQKLLMLGRSANLKRRSRRRIGTKNDFALKMIAIILEHETQHVG